jgi:hypothetical protein
VVTALKAGALSPILGMGVYCSLVAASMFLSPLERMSRSVKIGPGVDRPIMGLLDE